MLVNDAVVAVELVDQLEYNRRMGKHDVGNILPVSLLMSLHITIFDLLRTLFHHVNS